MVGGGSVRGKTGISVPHLAMAGTAAGSAAIVYALAQKTDPALLIKLFEGWGPLGVIVILGMVMANQWIGKGVEACKEIAASQQKVADSQQNLADSVKAIAAKDDERSREMELVVNHLARNSKQLLEDVSAMRREMGEMRKQLPTRNSEEIKGRGHTAGA